MASVEEIIEKILVKRGLKTERQRDAWLNPEYGALHDPYLLPDMAPAIKRLKRAKNKGEQVVIYGDYDVDGLCATALLSDALDQMGFVIETFIPDRFEDGYGLSEKALNKLVDSGAKLILTVDTGSTAIDQIRELKTKGVDVIVTDHHEPPAELPPARAVINPKRSDSRYPFRELAGSGVAFKLVQALQSQPGGLAEGREKWLLDLVALGTVCDVVPLKDENRALVYFGLKVLAQSRRPGLQALAEAADVSLRKADTRLLGFGLGPRLNAAGRLEHAGLSLRLLLSANLDEARPLAAKLDELNLRRQKEQALIESQAEDMLAEYQDHQVLVLAHADWSHGVVGIVAARLLERHKRPAFVMQITGKSAKGSARSFGDFDLSKALDSVRNMLLSGGGHSAAAGYTIAAKDIDVFRGALNDYWESLKLGDQSHHLEEKADMKMTDLSDLDSGLAVALELLAPFGHGNPEPRFAIDGLAAVNSRRVGAKSQHLKLTLADGSGRQIQAIAFNQTVDVKTGQPLSVIGKLRLNHYGGWNTPELVVSYLAPAGSDA